MTKFLPYWQYDVLAIENWLNDIAAQGYKLTQFGAYFCKFKKNEGKRVYYRVRYIDANKNIGNAFWWGDLYVYHSENPNDLPRPNYDEDARVCASKQGKPRQMILGVLAIAWILKDDFANIDLTNPLLTAASIATIFTWLLFLVSDFLQWSRANHIATGNITVTTNPPKPHLKLIAQISPWLGILSLALLLAHAYFYPPYTSFFVP